MYTKIVSNLTILWFLAMISSNSTSSTSTTTDTKAKCDAFLDHEYRLLHDSKQVNLCEHVDGDVLLVINTASHCGFTPQFKGLEALNAKYADKGLSTVGFASNDFNQETKDEAESAGICFKNFGVSFTMLAATPVRGDNANPTFQYLNQASEAPSWNFNKYLVDLKTGKVTHFSSQVAPEDSELEEAIAALLSKQAS